MGKHEIQVICKSIFMGGGNMTTKSQFTKKWIELVNQIEKNKSNLANRQ